MAVVSDVASAIEAAGVELAVHVPDSLLAPLIETLAEERGLRMIGVSDEATAVGIASGATLAGHRAIAVMESSGVRRAYESLARLILGHRIHCVLLVSDRGAFGERNWWGVGQGWTLRPLLDLLRVPHTTVSTVGGLERGVHDAFSLLDTRQCASAVIVAAQLAAELRGD